MSTGVFRHRFIPPPRPQNSSVIFAVNTTAAVLSNPTGTSTGATTALGTFDTDTNAGTGYIVTTQSATQPTAAQIKAGLNHLGAAADFSANQAIVTAGTKSFTITGLTEGLTYYNHFIQNTAGGGDSNIVTSAAFVPAASGNALIDETLKNIMQDCLGNVLI